MDCKEVINGIQYSKVINGIEYNIKLYLLHLNLFWRLSDSFEAFFHKQNQNKQTWHWNLVWCKVENPQVPLRIQNFVSILDLLHIIRKSLHVKHCVINNSTREGSNLISIDLGIAEKLWFHVWACIKLTFSNFKASLM